MHCFLLACPAHRKKLSLLHRLQTMTLTTANGAGTIFVDSDITGLFPFRDQLIIFCEERIFRLTGNTIADFVLQPMTREIGCINGFTIQEFAGDIVFLGPDGLRTVAGTERIGDVELGTILVDLSKNRLMSY